MYKRQDKENAARALGEKENMRKRLEVLQTATSGITNVARSLAKMAELKEAEQQAGKRQIRSRLGNSS